MPDVPVQVVCSIGEPDADVPAYADAVANTLNSNRSKPLTVTSITLLHTHDILALKYLLDSLCQVVHRITYRKKASLLKGGFLSGSSLRIGWTCYFFLPADWDTR